MSDYISLFLSFLCVFFVFPEGSNKKTWKGVLCLVSFAHSRTVWKNKTLLRCLQHLWRSCWSPNGTRGRHRRCRCSRPSRSPAASKVLKPRISCCAASRSSTRWRFVAPRSWFKRRRKVVSTRWQWMVFPRLPPWWRFLKICRASSLSRQGAKIHRGAQEGESTSPPTSCEIQRDAQQKRTWFCMDKEFLQHFSHVARIFSENLVWEAERLDDRQVASVIYTHCGRSPLHFKALPTPCAPLGLLSCTCCTCAFAIFFLELFWLSKSHGSFLIPKFCIVDSPNF